MISALGQARRFGHVQRMSATHLTAVTYAIWAYVAMGHERKSDLGTTNQDFALVETVASRNAALAEVKLHSHQHLATIRVLVVHG
jgi:hypothetical protein